MVQRLALVAVTSAMLGVATVASAQCPAPGTVSNPCSGAACAQLIIGDASGSSSEAGSVSISFKQAADDGQSQRGADDVAALAFTVGIPGSGSDAPLQFDCSGGNLAEGVVAVAPALANDFTVVVENAQCNNRNRCLCPDTGAGQERDNFVNIALYGPKTLPEQGPVSIPVLPDDGVIVTLKLKAASGVTSGTKVPLHAFSALDASKPQFAANLSMGDQSACDVSAKDNASTIAFDDGEFTVGEGGPSCVGDCNGDGQVAINELITGVNIALGSSPVSACPSFDVNKDGQVAINELITGVNNALGTCPS
ncbi:MAG: hypothetical protein SF182_29040 [Deltaproteobacteria bacterium]|nr:hypothetical protein [Deltaproteobacteria bacterium]